MGISNDVITNRLDKKINYGFARTDFDSNKSIAAESLTSPIPNPSHNLWMDSDLIPTVPPLTNTSEVAVYKYNSNASQGSSVGDVEGVFEFTVDGTVQNKRSWLMHSTPGDTTTDIKLGKSTGMKTILLNTGFKPRSGKAALLWCLSNYDKSL